MPRKEWKEREVHRVASDLPPAVAAPLVSSL